MKSILYALIFTLTGFNAHSQTSTCSGLLTTNYQTVEEFYSILETRLIESKIFLNPSVFLTVLKELGGPVIIKNKGNLSGLFSNSLEGLESVSETLFTLRTIDKTFFPNLAKSHEKDIKIIGRYFEVHPSTLSSYKEPAAQTTKVNYYSDKYTALIKIFRVIRGL